MVVASYLVRLARRLAAGGAALPASFRTRQVRYLLDAQHDDGGFGGRRGASDVYYTGFAVRLAQLLDVDAPEFHRGVARFLRKQVDATTDLVDGLSLLTAAVALETRGAVLWCDACRAERLDAVRATREAHRRDDGGFAETPGGAFSLYHTFVATLSGELLGEAPRDVDATARAVRATQQPGGAFGSEGTNPTVAAVATLAALDALDEDTARRAAAFLSAQQRPDGGFAAHPSAPVSDVMSTFTTLVALIDLGAVRNVSLGNVGRYVKSLARAEGAFAAVTGDDDVDIEYTYYGVGTLALLAAELSESGEVP